MEPIPAQLLPTFSLQPRALTVTLDAPVADTPPWLADLLRPGALPGVPPPDDALRTKVRDALRGAGFRPSGRSKPASEYLVRAAAEGRLQPIHPLVDATNAVSLASGLPASLVDLDRAKAPFRIEAPPPKTRYVFNRSGQEIDVGGLPCLWDAEGPCANAVKDAQRTKVTPETTRALFVAWAPASVPERTDAMLGAFARIVERLGGTTTPVPVEPMPATTA
ncbi:MAG: hypothetical protein D6705_13535 [Deltaproteobacteria bacterium]|nr:MAG: hypothetical protein D6705_13535 [Deltaproteobacteria bacterium]